LRLGFQLFNLDIPHHLPVTDQISNCLSKLLLRRAVAFYEILDGFFLEVFVFFEEFVVEEGILGYLDTLDKKPKDF